MDPAGNSLARGIRAIRAANERDARSRRRDRRILLSNQVRDAIYSARLAKEDGDVGEQEGDAGAHQDS